MKSKTKESSVRGIALNALQRIENQQLGSQAVLYTMEQSLNDPRDKSLLHNLVLGVLRNRLLLDWLIMSRVHKPRKLEHEVLQILRLGIYQCLFLTRIPDYAIINESVELAKKRIHKGAGSLVNAVLRTFKQQSLAELTHSLDSSNLKDRSVLDSHPEWLLSRWQKNFSPQIFDQIVNINNHVPPFYIRSLDYDLSNNEKSLQECLAIGYERIRDVQGAIRVFNPYEFKRLDTVYPDVFQVQDLHSQWIATQIHLNQRDCYCDLCAGRGGKTLVVLSDMGKRFQGNMWAFDISVTKLSDLHDRLAKRAILNKTRVRLCCWDHRISLTKLHNRFDTIIVDAPCSNSGVIRRHPELKWRLTEANIKRHAEKQQLLLKNGLSYLAPDGQLFYIVCSLEPEEGIECARSVINTETSISIEPLTAPTYSGCISALSPEGCLTLFPSDSGGDGFFITKFLKSR